MVPFNLEKSTSPIVVMPKLKISLQSLSKGLISSFELAGDRFAFSLRKISHSSCSNNFLIFLEMGSLIFR